MIKNPPANARNTRGVGLIHGSGRFPWRRKWQPYLVFLPGQFQGQRSPSPWGCKVLDTIECVCTHGDLLLGQAEDLENKGNQSIFITQGDSCQIYQHK